MDDLRFFSGTCSAFTHVATRSLALGGVGLPSSNEGHPMDHDSNPSGHTKSKDPVDDPLLALSVCISMD